MSIPSLRESERSMLVSQMSDEEINTVQQRMYPGGWSVAGFLLENQSLKQIVEEDSKILAEHSITHRQMALQLTSVVEKANRISREKIHSHLGGRYLPLVEGKYLVEKDQTKGIQCCPFSLSESNKDDCGGSSGSAEYVVTHFSTGKKFGFPSLMPHLIRDHHFFERGPYAVDPREMIEFFQIQADSKAEIQYETRNEWIHYSGSGSSRVPEEHLAYAKQICSDSVCLAPGIEAFLIERKEGALLRPFNMLPPNKTCLYIANHTHDALDFSDSPRELWGSIVQHFLMDGETIFSRKTKRVPVLADEDSAVRLQTGVFNSKGDFFEVKSW